MSIVYTQELQTFTLSGGDVSYVLHVTPDGMLMNLYWGKRVPNGSVRPGMDYYPGYASFDLPANRQPHELPCPGHGWYGTPAIWVENGDGNDVTDLRYVCYQIVNGKEPLEGLPCTYAESGEEAQSLLIEMQDELTGLCVTVQYAIYEKTGAMTRSLRLMNRGKCNLQLKAAMAASVPLYGSEYDVVHLKGAWAAERGIVRTPVGESEYRIFSQRGASGHEENPFLAICEKNTDEHSGSVWALSFVYSGSFLACAYVDGGENSRLSIGMNPSVFSWKLQPGESFQTPEAIQVFSDCGMNGMSHIFHELFRTRLARGVWRDKERPVLINNWEGTYFDFNEEKILAIAQTAKQIGVELFVLDDGWFGRRNSDASSLGDWYVNTDKLPDGISGLSDKIHAMGLQFGLWFEPEMISPVSDLYDAHPDWCLNAPGRSRTQSRHQLILDLSRKDVQDYVIGAVSSVLSSARIDYVKWDMNRNMTEAFSPAAPKDRQMETQHRYMLGLYRVLHTIVNAFPNTLFESCSGGGGRFDPGMLAYMPQTWTSDNTDAVARLSIQYGTSMLYPSSAMGAHVSASPNHQLRRPTSLEMRGDVALGGNFGFELDLTKASSEELDGMRQLVEKVKGVRGLVQKGVFSRLISPFEGHFAAWQFVSADQSDALLCVYGILAQINKRTLRIKMVGLDPEAVYQDEQGTGYCGAVLMNMGLWVNLKGDFCSKTIRLRKMHG